MLTGQKLYEGHREVVEAVGLSFVEWDTMTAAKQAYWEQLASELAEKMNGDTNAHTK